MVHDLSSCFLAVCAALIGACYLASFCTAKRAIARATILANQAFSPLAEAAASSTGVKLLGQNKDHRVRPVFPLQKG